MIYVFAHKPFDDTVVDGKDGYRVLWVNPAVEPPKPTYDCDRRYDDNIAERNARFSELTGVYHIWKNHTEDDIIGLCQYRCYFAERKCRKRLACGKARDHIVDYAEVEKILQKKDVILPPKSWYYEKKGRFRLHIFTVQEHYEYFHYAHDLDKTEAVLLKLHPEYMDAFHRVMKKKTVYFRNMMITKREIFTAYCEWLFPILFEIENRTDFSDGYDGTYQSRLLGYLAERLFNVWLAYNHKKYRIVSLPQVNTESAPNLGIANDVKRLIVAKIKRTFGKVFRGA